MSETLTKKTQRNSGYVAVFSKKFVTMLTNYRVKSR